MELLLVLVVVAIVSMYVATRRRAAREAELLAADQLRAIRKVADEDVTRFGEELQELHVDTLTTELDAPMRQDYQRALDSYENAKLLLADAREPADITEVTRTLEDGRYAQACVLARQAEEPVPQRRPPCFFNPAHGPAQTDIEWSPPGGVPREIPVCLADAERIGAGAEPDSRKVRLGNRMVPWYQAGPRYAAYADGYYGVYAMSGLFPAVVIGSMMATVWGHDVLSQSDQGGGWVGGDGSGGGWSDPGGWTDSGGWDSGGGGWGGGHDGGGGGGGGFDGGGGGGGGD